MQILPVIKRHGYTLEQVATALGITKGALSVSLNGSPNVKKLIDIALIIGCSPAEFFDDWYDNEGKAQQQPATDKMDVGHSSGTEGKQAPEPTVDDALPFNGGWQPAATGALTCPHCGKPFVVEVKGV